MMMMMLMMMMIMMMINDDYNFMIMDHIYIYILKAHRHDISKICIPSTIPPRSNVRVAQKKFKGTWKAETMIFTRPWKTGFPGNFLLNQPILGKYSRGKWHMQHPPFFVDHFSRRRYSFLEIFNILQYANCFEIFQLATLPLATATKAGMRTQGIFFHYGHAAHQSGTQALKPAALRLWLAIEQWHPKLGLSKKCGQDKHSLWMLMVILNVDMMNTLGNLAWFVQPYDLIIHLFCTLLMSIIIQNSGVYPIISAS